jgi:nitrate reductase NapE component
LSPLKQRAVIVFVVVFGLWPVIHIGLSFGFGVNPWNLAGWGMYAAPQFPAEVLVTCRGADGSDRRSGMVVERSATYRYAR